MIKIAIHGVPRSGTTWLGEIFNSCPEVAYRYQPLFSYAFKGRISADSSSDEIDRFFEEISVSDDDFICQTDKRGEGLMPTFSKEVPTTVVYKEVRYHNVLNRVLAISDVKVIGIVRNPLAVINSWLNAPREFRADLGWDELVQWRYASRKNQGKPEEYHGYEKWKDAALSFRRLSEQYPDSFRLVTYRDLIRDTSRIVEDLFSWCGLEVGAQTREFIADSSSRTVEGAYSVFRAAATDEGWRQSLNSVIVREIVNDLRGSDLEDLLDLTAAEMDEMVLDKRPRPS